MNTVDDFKEGDTVIFTKDKGNIETAQKYSVVGKTNDEVILLEIGDNHYADPSELLTPKEIADAKDEIYIV